MFKAARSVQDFVQSSKVQEVKYFTAMKINEIGDMNIIAVSVISLKINPLPLKKEKFRTSTGFEPMVSDLALQ